MASIRLATSHDLDEIIRLASATPEAAHWPRDLYERFLSPYDPTTQIFIAENNGTIAGFAAVQSIIEVCELESITVDSPFRRSGIGNELLASVIEWARKHTASRVQLEVRSGNTAAIALYERSGFSCDGLRPGYYSDPPEDALLMSLSLAPRNTP
jgi:ribosomal-protein-alanine N-acetyltransferase